ncbi:MAG: AAA family ATPase [Magnetococcus sp. WYHC-3]
MKIFAVYNLKGGVGKTTTAVNLAYLSAREGRRTLVWDLDPQGATSYYLCVKSKVKGGARRVLKGERGEEPVLRMTGYPHLDLLPADLSYRKMDLLLDGRKPGRKGLLKALEPFANEYDRIVLDCPPGLSLVSENIFQMADVLVIPLLPSTLSLRAYNKLVHFLMKNRGAGLKVAPFFSMVDLSRSIHRVVSQRVLERHPIFLRNMIPQSTLVEAMGIKRAPLFIYARDSREAELYRALWAEIVSRAGPEAG